MPLQRHRHPGRCVVRLLVLVLALGVTGCSRWVPLEKPLAERRPGPLRDRAIRVTLADGERVMVTFPVVTAESTLTSQPPVGKPGFAVPREEGEVPAGQEPDQYPSYPLSSIRLAEAERGQTGLTAALTVLGGFILIGSLVSVLVANSWP